MMTLKVPLNVNIDQLTDDEKDDFCQKLIEEDLGNLSDPRELKNALKVFQGLLRLKVEQVESLALELDELASKQGEEEARLVQEIKDLQAQLVKSPPESVQHDDATEYDLRQMLHTSEVNSQRLLAELQAQEQEQLSNKMEMEKLESQLALLENERLQLRQELSALQEEIHSQQKEAEPHIEEPQKNYQQLVESLRQKNKHLSALLSDVEVSEKENIALREKLTNIKIELAEATKNIMHTTGELVTLQVTKDEQTERIHYLEQMCEALRHQVEDLNYEKQKRDGELETFKQEIDIRIQEWKEVVEKKEQELASLHERLALQNLKGQSIIKSCDSEQTALLSQTLQKRECQIDELQAQLSLATRDLNETTALLEKIQPATEISPNTPGVLEKDVSQKLLAAEEKIKALEGKLIDAENDADGKSEEITKMIIQLRSYEAGEFGLTEALAQIKDLSQQKLVRDKHIEQLVETANSLRVMCDNLHEENLTLREKLDIPPEEYVETSAMVLIDKEKNLSKVQQQQIDRLQEDLINAKMDKRNLTQEVLQLSKHVQELEALPQVVQRTPNMKNQNRVQADARAAARKIRSLQQAQHQLDIQRQSLIEENEALRQGLHDILDSVHNQDGKSSVRLESKVLEHLLHALDSRHISGWYHPAMRIQAKVDVVEGNNEALREQLHNMREEAFKTQGELQKAKQHIAELESNKNVHDTLQSAMGEDFVGIKGKQKEIQVTLNLPIELPAQGLGLITNLNNHLLEVLHEQEVDKDYVMKTHNIQRELQFHLDEVVSQLVQAVEQQTLQTENWQEQKNKFEGQIDELQAKLSASEKEASLLQSMWNSLSPKDQEKCQLNIQDIMNIAALSAEKVRQESMTTAALHQAKHAKKQLKFIKTEWNNSKKWITKQFGEFLRFKKTMLHHISDLELILMDSVPTTSFNAAINKLGEVTANYNKLLRQHEMSMSKVEREMKNLTSKLELEQKNRKDFENKLEEAQKKLLGAGNIEGASTQDNSKEIPRLESEVLRAKQQVSHVEKLYDIAKAEVQQLSERCQGLEQEILELLTNNQKLKCEAATLHELTLTSIHHEDKDNLQSQLSSAKAEVDELQAYRKHLQELSEISQAQVNMLEQLHERSELQLDSLRQVMCKLQGETNQGAEIARLTEDLCASQINEMAAWNQISSLERELSKLTSSNEENERHIEELQRQIYVTTQKKLEQYRKMKQEIIDLRMHVGNTLPLAFFHFVVSAFTQRSVESRSFWNDLQEVKAKLISQSTDELERKVSCQQTLELQSALTTCHSDLHCQRTIESLAEKLTKLKLKELRSARQCEILEANLKQTQERLHKEEELLSTLEQQLLSLDTKRLQYSLNRDNEEHQENVKVVEMEEKHEDKLTFPQKMVPQSEDNQQISEASKNNIAGISQMQYEENNHLKEQLSSLKEEIRDLTEAVKKKESELESCKTLCNELRQSQIASEIDQLSVTIQQPVSEQLVNVNKGEQIVNAHNKVALQATVDSLQNIIIQKEDTICRYQKLLRDVREEDARIISTLQEHLRNLQADLTAQEQAYMRLKISMHHLSLETTDSHGKAALDFQLTRTNELEDEVALISTKLSSVSTELQSAQREAAYWNTVAKQHQQSIEELNFQLLEYKNSDLDKKKQAFFSQKHETLALIGAKDNIFNPGSPQRNHEKVCDQQQVCKRCKDGLTRNKDNPVQMHLSAEVTELRNKILQMEEQERHNKSEIQRLKDQIPIYSRRSQQFQCNPTREAELLKKISTLEQQMEHMKLETEKAVNQRSQQEMKKIKSVENVARWDERKKHQTQIERLKNSLQEQANGISLLHDKMEKMHSTVHRLEREKIALEHQNRNLRRTEQEKMLLEEKIQKIENNNVPQQLLDELRQERDQLYAEVKVLRSKQTLALQENKEYLTDVLQKEKADLMKANLELECENLELKLELEKLRSEMPCLQHKILHLERVMLETCKPKRKQLSTESMQHTHNMMEQENKTLKEKVECLTAQLEASNYRVKVLENCNDGSGKIGALQSELHQKSLLLGKVKTLLERAAMKERELTEQVHRLESALHQR